MQEENWKHRWLPLCLARHARKVRKGRPVARLMISSQNLRVSWKPVKPQDCVAYGRLSTKLSWGPHCRKREQFTTTLQFGTQIYSYACNNEDTRSKKQQWIKKWEETWKDSGVESDKSQKQIRGDRWSKDEGRKKFILPHWWTSVIWKCWIGDKAPKVQRSSCTSRRHCKIWFWIFCSIHRTRIISITNDGSKGHGYHIQTTRMRTSSWRSICLYPCKNGRCSKIIENSQIGMYRHSDSSTTTQNGLNHGPVWKIQSFPLNEICTVILWQFCFGKGNLRKSYWSTVGRKFPIGNVSSFIVKKDYSYLCMWMTSNWLERNKTLIRCGKYSIKKSIWENQHLFWIMCTWAALKDSVK